ncbi:MAG: formate dehydrogenase accessory sulfurtransferase FdhD [Deltaproteobacteria bacterium]|nr:formate dehydrogenase accessory sulfurtransferase FdhD [Deltaproteobacteria bacterium]
MSSIQTEQKVITNDYVNEPFNVIRCYRGDCIASEHELINEEPLTIRVEGEPYSVIMRTPGEENFHAAGFCLAEGLVDDFKDFATIGFCEDLDPNVVDVRLSPARRGKVGDLLARRGFISQTSCGICGKEMVEDMCQIMEPVTDGFSINLDDAVNCIDRLSEIQTLYRKTRGSHAALLLDSQLDNISVAEDVGRHNALDKTIGKAFIGGKLKEGRVVVLSSRISYEMVQKAARAHIPIIFSTSRPTALAVTLGEQLNMTLACAAREGELIVFCGEERIKRE